MEHLGIRDGDSAIHGGDLRKLLRVASGVILAILATMVSTQTAVAVNPGHTGTITESACKDNTDRVVITHYEWESSSMSELGKGLTDWHSKQKIIMQEQGYYFLSSNGQSYDFHQAPITVKQEWGWTPSDPRYGGYVKATFAKWVPACP